MVTSCGYLCTIRTRKCAASSSAGWIDGALPAAAAQRRFVPPARIPGARIGHLAVAFLPERFFAGAHQGNAAPCITGISVRPMISSRRSVCATSSSRHWSPLTTVMPSTSTCGDWISSSQRLHVAAAGTGTIFVDNDLAPRLAPGDGTSQQQRNREPRSGPLSRPGAQNASLRANCTSRGLFTV